MHTAPAPVCEPASDVDNAELRVALASARSRRELTSRHEATRPISRGYGATLARRDALDPATRRVVDAVKRLAVQDGGPPPQWQAIRTRTSLEYRAIKAVASNADDALLLAYDEISADLLDELRDWVEASHTAEGRIAACIGAVVDFAATGGRPADIWFNTCRAGGLDVRDRRDDVLLDVAHLMFHGSDGPRRHAGTTREMLVLGGVLEILSTRLRDRDHPWIAHAKPELVSLVWRQTS